MTTYFVSTSGSDAANGTSTSTPWATIAKVNGSSFSPGDVISFNGGQTFTGPLVPPSSGSVGNPIVFTSYGTGRATISSAANVRGVFILNLSNITVSNFIMVGSSANPAVNSGHGFRAQTTMTDATKFSGISLINCDISLYAAGIILANSATADAGSSGFSNFLCDQCNVHNNGDGFQSWSNSTAGGVRCHSNVTVSNFQFANNAAVGTTSGQGNITFGAVSGGLIFGGQSSYYGAATTANGVGVWCYDSDNILMQYVESHHNSTASGFDGGGFDIDQGCTGCTIEYCYAHDNQGYGYLLDTGSLASTPYTNNTVRYCISENDGALTANGSITIANDGGESMTGIAIYNNTVFTNKDSSHAAMVIAANAASASGHIANNIFYTSNGASLLTSGGNSGIGITGNNYFAAGAFKMIWNGVTYTSYASWQTAVGREFIGGVNVGLHVNPMMVDPGNGGTVLGYNPPFPVGYELNVGSPMIGAGLNLSFYEGGFTGFFETTSPQKHNPWQSFSDSLSLGSDFSNWPTDFTQLPAISFVVPNLTDDMHDGTIAQGDTWLQTHLDSYIQWAKSHNSVFILVFDEDDGSQSNQVLALSVGAGITVGSDNTVYNHYSTLRSMEAAFNVSFLGAAATAVPLPIGVAHPDHIVLCIMENHSYNEIIASAPYINSLITQGRVYTNYFAISHPSEPNYFALFTGSTWGVVDDGGYLFSGPSLGGQMSTVVGFGINVGTQDFYGNTIPNANSRFPIGAYGGSGFGLNSLSSTNLTYSRPLEDGIPSLVYLAPVIRAANLSLQPPGQGVNPLLAYMYGATSLTSSGAGLGQPSLSFPNVPAVRSISTISYGSRTNLTLTPPAGLVNNDVLLGFVVNTQIGSAANTAISLPLGFNPLFNYVVTDGNGTFLRGVAGWKTAASESGSYTFNTASGNSEGILIDISGAVNAGNVIDVFEIQGGSVISTSSAPGGTQSVTATASSITTTMVDDLTIYLTSAFSGYPNAAAPAGITPLLNDLLNGVMFAGWEPELNSGSSTGAVSMQVNSTANAFLASLITIRSIITLNTLLSNSLIAGSASLGQPVFNQTDKLTASSLIAGGSGVGVPLFTQIDKLIAVNLSSGAASLGSSVLVAANLAFGAPSLSAGSANLGSPSLNWLATATSLSSGGVGLGQPAFNKSAILAASNLASGAAGLGSPALQQSVFALHGTNLAAQASTGALAVLSQTKNTFTATPLTSQASTAALGALNTIVTTFSSAANYGTTSPILDAGVPTLTFSSAFGFTATSLTAGAAGFDRPAVVQQQVINTLSLTAGSAGFDQPQFVQFNLLTPTNLAAGAAGIGIASISTLTVNLSAQLSFVSIDSSINQLNAAISGIPLSTSLGISTNAMMLGYTSPVSIVNVNASAAIAIANKALMPVSASWSIKEQQRLLNSASMSSSLVMNANAATGIFDNPRFVIASALQAALSQSIVDRAGAISSAALIAHEAMLQLTLVRQLTSNTVLFANIIKQAVTAWSGSSLLSPVNTMTGTANQNIAASALLGSSVVFGVSVQNFGGITAMSPVSTLGALATAQLPFVSTISPAALVAISERMLTSATAVLVPSSIMMANGLLWKFLNVGLSAQVTMLPAGFVQSQSATQLNSSSLVRVVEFQRLAMKSSLALVPVLGISLNAMLLPFAVWNAQSTLTVNERVLPFGTAFYFAHINLAVAENQLMVARTSASLQPQLIPHEGLLMLQPPLVTSASVNMATAEHVVMGPNLKLLSNIVLNISTPIGYANAHSSLASLTDFENQFVLQQSFGSVIHNGSTVSVFPKMAMAGIADLSSACYFNPVVTMQRNIEISAMITAKKSRTRIVAQGNLVRKYE
jgi:hypothetical protein